MAKWLGLLRAPDRPDVDLGSIDAIGFEVTVQVCTNPVAAAYVAEVLNIEQLGNSVQSGALVTRQRRGGRWRS